MAEGELLMSMIQLGITTMHSTALPSEALTDESFRHKRTTLCSLAGTTTTQEFKFKEYAPNVFSRLRDHFGVSTKYMSAIQNPSERHFDGSQFWISADNLVMVVRISKTQSVCLRRILSRYYFHMEQHHRSLLPRFLQLVHIKTVDGIRSRAVIMSNTIIWHTNIQRYHLKGTNVHRRTRLSALDTLPRPLRDSDFVINRKRVQLPPAEKTSLLHQIQIDTNFLASCHLMNYVFVLCFLDAQSPRHSSGGAQFFQATDEHNTQQLICCSIANILQGFGHRKRAESVVKKMVAKRIELHSAVAPRPYAQRFVDFLRARVIS